MDGNEDSEDDGRKKKRLRTIEKGGKGNGEDKESGSFYLPYFKPNYNRVYPEHSTNMEFKVFVENLNKEKLGNKSPIYLNHIFTTDIKGISSIHRVNAMKIAVVFKQYNTANNFLLNNVFLDKYQMKAYIPAHQIEATGIIRFVPTNISNKELYTKLSSTYEIIAVRRFTKRVEQEVIPLQTVSITFLTNVLPQNIQYDLFSYRVFDYIPPLQQCYRCFKFNHSAKICNGKQRCSICAGEHSYKECDKPNELCCVNCSGPHLAISRACPIKMNKISEKRNKITYASIANSKSKSYKEEYPLITKKISNQPETTTINKNKQYVNNKTNSKVNLTDLKSQLLQNNDLIMAIVRTLIELANKGDETPITTTSIKDLLLKNIA